MHILRSHGGLPELHRHAAGTPGAGRGAATSKRVGRPLAVAALYRRTRHPSAKAGAQAPLERSIGSSRRIRSTAPLSRHAFAHESRLLTERHTPECLAGARGDRGFGLGEPGCPAAGLGWSVHVLGRRHRRARRACGESRAGAYCKLQENGQASLI